MNKYLETPLHSFTCFLSSNINDLDIGLLCNAANSPFAWIARLRGIRLAINVDGIERRRSKWSRLGKWWYRLGEVASTVFANKVVADAETIANYYRTTYGVAPTVIRYGASAHFRAPGNTLTEFNLRARQYILYVSRLEPENNALLVLQAYKKAGITVPLVVVGDAPYADAYKRQLYAEAGLSEEGIAEKRHFKLAEESGLGAARIVFTGYQFGKAYQELQSNCLMYVQATEVGGTHPALVEAMSYGNCILANGTPENFETLGEAGEYYLRNDRDSLAAKLSELVCETEAANKRAEELRKLALERANLKYSWDAVTQEYESLLLRIVGTP